VPSSSCFFSTAGYTAWKAVSDHWTYGDYPTTHLTANFGHGGLSHVVAFMNGHYAEIIEMVGTNMVNVYAIKVSSSEQRVVTLEVQDVNGDGKRDLVVTVEGVSERPILLNTGKGFEWKSQCLLWGCSLALNIAVSHSNIGPISFQELRQENSRFFQFLPNPTVVVMFFAQLSRSCVAQGTGDLFEREGKHSECRYIRAPRPPTRNK
jgi:hypothetical protein